jgi:hypothetical protein
VLEKRVDGLEGPLYGSAQRSTQSPYARRSSKPPQTNDKGPFSSRVLPQGAVAAVHTGCSAPLLDSNVPAVAPISHRLKLDIIERQIQRLSWAFCRIYFVGRSVVSLATRPSQPLSVRLQECAAYASFVLLRDLLGKVVKVVPWRKRNYVRQL